MYLKKSVYFFTFCMNDRKLINFELAKPVVYVDEIEKLYKTYLAERLITWQRRSYILLHLLSCLSLNASQNLRILVGSYLCCGFGQHLLNFANGGSIAAIAL